MNVSLHQDSGKNITGKYDKPTIKLLLYTMILYYENKKQNVQHTVNVLILLGNFYNHKSNFSPIVLTFHD